MSSNWHSNWYPAPRSLVGVLAGIWSVRAACDADLSARVLPDGSTCLVFLRDGTVLRSGDRGWATWVASSVSGPRKGSFDIKLGTAGQIMIVQLLPAGATQVLGVPMSLLADRYEPLDTVVGKVPPMVSDCLHGDADEFGCVRTIERWLLNRVRSQRPRCEVTDAVAQEVARQVGNIRIQDLAAHVGLSRRHLGRIIHERVGLSPKRFARITRFNLAVRLGRMRPVVPLARIALDAGYADQAHLAREFAALGGIRPSDLRGKAAATIW